jgi:hypothetical protein
MSKKLFSVLVLISAIFEISASDNDRKSLFVPPPTDRNFSIVCAFSWMSMAELSPAAYNMDLSVHYIKPYFALDVSYEKGLQDWFREPILGAGEYPAIDEFNKKLEVNAAITYRSKVSKKGSLFYRGSTYRGGSQYDVYSRGEGDAALYKQIRFGGSDRLFTYPSKGFELSPVENSSEINGYIRYNYPKVDIFTAYSNRCYHLGLGSTKVYKTESPSISSGTDRIGMVKFYADVLYSPTISYRFFNEDGTAPFTGLIPDQVFQKVGFRLGTETNRLNAFSGYWSFEFGVMPGLRPLYSKTNDQFLFYVTLKFGLETGWPLLNSKYR